MGQSFRALLGALLIFSGLAACLFWAITPMRPFDGFWIGRITCTSLAVISAGILIWAKTLKSKAPDLLAKNSKHYFERNGFCFAVIPQISDRGSVLSIYYQNRYAQPCKAKVMLSPLNVAFKDVSDLPEIEVAVDCLGGEYGRMFCNFGLPLRFKGQKILWNIAATSDYPEGRGELLRLRDGLRVGTVAKVSTGQELAKTVGYLVFHVPKEKPARLMMKFPDATFANDQIGVWVQETIWTLESQRPT